MSEKRDRKAVAAWLVEVDGMTEDAAARVAAAFSADWVADLIPRLTERNKRAAAHRRKEAAADAALGSLAEAEASCAPYRQRAARILAAMRDEAEGGAA
jgi:hypothetical protein